VPRLVEVLREDASPGVRARAAQALGRIGHAAALPALHDALEDTAPRVSRRAREALDRFEEHGRP